MWFYCFYTYLRRQKKAAYCFNRQLTELRRPDSNERPLGYEPNELPLLHSAILDCKGNTIFHSTK